MAEKRCLYSVLGVAKDCSQDEIRSAYKRLALRLHPDKLVSSGSMSEADATAQFQELVHAYEVLSDPRERSWYDSHRSQILFSDQHAAGTSFTSELPNLFSFFSNSVYSGYSDTGKGFYKVYSDLFNKIYQNELNFVNKLGLQRDLVKDAPLMGNLESPYAQVTAFYNYWSGFSTVMDFCWEDKYDVTMGVNRRSRRLMEEDNKKARKKARREYNEIVRDLAAFVKRRDKRVIDMGIKRNAELERKKEEEKERRKSLEKERMERARLYEEPEWARIDEEEVMDGFEEEEKKDEEEGKELFCLVCSKKFKSEKQWKNHEQSKKHREKVAELRQSFRHKKEESEEGEEEESDGFEDLRENVENVDERFKEGLKIEDEGEKKNQNEGEVDEGHGEADGLKEGLKIENKEDEEEKEIGGIDEGRDEEDGVEDDEMSLLKNMVFGDKNRVKNTSARSEAEVLESEVQLANDNDEGEFREYNNRKSTGRNRKGRRQRGKKNGGGEMVDDVKETNSPDDESPENDSDDKSTRRNRKGRKQRGKKNGGGTMVGDVDGIKRAGDDGNRNDNGHMEESTSKGFVADKINDKADEQSQESSNEPLDETGGRKKDTTTKAKKSSKGKKAKAASKNSGNMCDKCGEEFESKNKLHKHLADSGHATLKFR